MAYKLSIGAQKVSGNMTIESAYDLLAGKDSTQDIGATGTRFENIWVDTVTATALATAAETSTVGNADHTTFYGDGSNLTNVTAELSVTGSNASGKKAVVLTGELATSGVKIGAATTGGSNTLTDALFTFTPSTGLLSGSGAIHGNSLSLNGAAAITNQGVLTLASLTVDDGSTIGSDTTADAITIAAAGQCTFDAALTASAGSGFLVSDGTVSGAALEVSAQTGDFLEGNLSFDQYGFNLEDSYNITVGATKQLTFSDSGSHYDSPTQLQVSGTAHFADDAELYFGAQADASIKWTSADSELTIAGATNFSNAVEIAGNVTLGNAVGDTVTVTGVATVTNGLTASMGMLVKDDHKLYFGDGQDASLEYDEDGTNELRFAGAAVTFEEAATFDNHVVLGDDTDADIVSVSGSLQMDSGIRYTGTYVAVEATCILALTSSYVIGKATGAQAVRLPTSPEHGDWFAIKRHPQAGGDITISGSGTPSYHIDDETEVVLETAGSAVTLIYDSTTDNWNIF